MNDSQMPDTSPTLADRKLALEEHSYRLSNCRS